MSLGCGEWGLCLGPGRVGEDYESPLSCDDFYHRSVEVLFHQSQGRLCRLKNDIHASG